MHTPRFIVAGLILLGAPIFTSCDSGRPPDSPPVPCTSLSGEVDTAFATNGWFIHDGATGGNGSDLSHALVEDAQGRIIIAGESTGAAPGSEMVLWRLLPDGSPDASFGGVGWITHQGAAGGSAGDVAYGVVVDGQGRIVATGASSGAGGNALDMAVWRYLEDGTLDPGFGVGGVFTHHDGAGGGDQDIGRDLIVDANDRIVVTGSSLNATFGVSMMVWRLTGDGVLDSRLGGGGFVAYLGDDPSPGIASGNALAQDPSGMILVAGTSTVFGPAMTIWRLRDDGGLDPEWGGTG
ncbi:MAG: hypothetical protein O7H41_16995, partial [Planctomycetota bacterium]|nr:hypothetical protein [Planctomycetota bacterium]